MFFFNTSCVVQRIHVFLLSKTCARRQILANHLAFSFFVARNYASEVRTDIESATAEIESEVMKEQEFIGGISDDLNTIEEETKGSMPKIVDIEPVFETNVNDFQEKNDDDAIDTEEDKNNE